MNVLKTSVVVLASAIALAGCGDKKSSSDKAKVYKSETCMEKKAQEKLLGENVSLESACLNKTSVEGKLVIETNKGWNAKLKLNDKENAKGLANGLIHLAKTDKADLETKLKTLKLEKKIEGEIIEAAVKGDAKSLASKLLDNKKTFKLFYVANNTKGIKKPATGGKAKEIITFQEVTSDFDYSLEFKFDKAATYTGLVRELHLVNKDADKTFAQAKGKRAELATAFQPRAETYTFLIQDPEAAKKDKKGKDGKK